MKKSIIKSITLGIGGLLSLSFLLGIGLSNQFNNKKDNNALLETSVNDQFIHRNYINTEGTLLPTSGTLSAGTYYLTSDLTVSSQLKITSGNVIVNLNSFTLNGGGRDKGIFHVSGGTLTVNGKSDEIGNLGTLNNGGGYYPGSGYSYGGALYITSGGATFNDLNITNCQSNWGGAIYMTKSAVTLNNCNLSNNKATNGYGFHGAISVDDSSIAGTGLTVNGGEMFSNDAAIYVGTKAKATINGVYIHDNDTYGVCVATNEGEGSLTISGNTIIKDNNPSSGNLHFNSNNVIKAGIVSGLGNDAYIGVTISGDTKGVFTNSTDTSLNDFSKFFSDDANYAVAKNSDGQLFLSEAIATVTSGETVTEYSNISDAVSSWNSAASGATLTLLKDSVTSSTITVENTRTLDLNGYGLRASNNGFRIFNVDSSCNLTVNDSNPSHAHEVTLSNYLATGVSDGTGEDNVNNGNGTAYINGGYVAGGYDGTRGGAFYVSGGTLTLNGGTVIGNRCDQNGCAGGGIYVESNGYFTMNGGSIKYNYAGNAGAGIAAINSTIEINGGVISFNTNNWSGGGAMSLSNSSSLKLYGGVIENNVSKHAEGAISFKSDNQYLSIKGSPIVRNNTSIETGYGFNLLLNHGVVAKIEGPLTEEADIHICSSGNDPSVITDGWSTYMGDVDPADYFFHDNPDYYVYLKDGEAYAKVHPAASISDGTTVTEYNSFNDALVVWTDGTTLTLLKDITTSETINVNYNVTLDLNGYGIKATGTDYSVLTINDGGKLTIIDSGDTTQYFTIADRYAGNGAGFATVCDKATYDATDENLRGTFQGGYITGGNIIDTGFYQNKAGAITIMTGGELDFKAGTIIGNSGGKESPGGVSTFGTFTLNGGNIIYNRGRRGSGVFLQVGTFIMNSGSIEYNTGVGAGEYGTAAFHSYPAESISLNGGSISHNYTKYGGIATSTSILLSGDFVAVDNVACGSTGTETANGNVRLTDGALISGCITGNTPIGISLGSGSGVFTNNTDTSINDPSKFVSDNPNYAIGVYPAGHANAGQLLIGNKVTVTYTTEYGTTPASDIVANGSIIYNKPTSPSQEGYVFKGWYKDEEFENAWDFATDTVTSNTTLYAKWFDVATDNVIKLINDIGDLTYDGGVNDSLDDIVAAKTAYDALTPSQKAVVDKENKDVLDHDILTYRHVDNVGDLIKEIPEASDSQEYYDAVETALAAYNALTDEEKEILNANLDFQYKKTLDDNVAAKEAIELIQDIGDVTYNGGQDDSKDDINAALDAYNNLTDDQKEIVDNANKDTLDDAKETYDDVDEAVNLINSIGDINHGGDNDSQEDINAAREAYDNLSDEEKVLVDSYHDSTQTLEDAEEVYDVLVKIDAIGEGDDDEKIKAARDAYDDLTPEQKDKVGDEYFHKLIDAENHSRESKKQAKILFIVFLILSILLIVSGLIVLYVLLKRRKGENNSNNNQVKLASVTGLLPFVILASYFRSTKFIIVYILAAVAILIWLINLILFVSNKRKKEAKVEDKSEIAFSNVPQGTQTELINEDEEEVETIRDEKGNIFQIRFIKSFTAKLIQSPDETKKYYEELKNEVLSYKKTNSRISWHYDAINSGRNYVLKFAVRGKTLCVYFPLNADDYVDSKYKVEKVESKKFEDVPCLYRIKNDRRLGYAKELIAVVAFNLGLEKGEERHEVYSNLPYEPNKPLVARGLIKEQKIQVNKPVEPQVLETKVNSDGDEVIVTKDASGNIFEIRYIKSFTAKLSQSENVVKEYYTILKNYALAYKGSHSRVSWHYDAINVGRDYVLKFAIRGKTLCVYFALDASKLDGKYKVEVAKGKRFIDTPCLYRIKNDRRCEYAKELIDEVMKKVDASKGKEPNEDYRIAKESTKALLEKSLIKELKTKVVDKKVVEHYESITVSKADEVMSDEKAEASIEEVEINKHKEGSKAIINIDTLSEHYNNGDEVTLDSLIEKGLVPSKVGHIKILARGELSKKLYVVANEYSLQAIKMIVLVGGTVKKVK